MAAKEQDTYKDIVFGYSSITAISLVGYHGRNCDWDCGDFSIAISEDGSLMHKTYLSSGIEKTAVKYKISINTVKAIKAVIEERQEDIDSFDRNLWNGIFNRCGDIFVFNGKELITWNIGVTERSIEDKREETEEEEWEREKEKYPHIYKYRQYMEKYGTKVEAEIKAKAKAKMEAKIRAEQAAQREKLVIKEERKILSIFEAIAQLLEQDGVKLKQGQVNFDEATLDVGE